MPLKRGEVLTRRSSSCTSQESHGINHEMLSSDSKTTTSSKLVGDDDDGNCKRPGNFVFGVIRTITVLLAVVTIFGLVAASLVWVSLYTGVYDRDSTCPVRDNTFEPWCEAAITHHNTNNLAPPLSPREWYELRKKYHRAVGESASSLASNWEDLYKELPTTEDSMSETRHSSEQKQVHNNGYLIPIEIKSTPERGRGVFTTVNVKKGQKIWENRFRGNFPDACSGRKFFASLTNEEACDAMFW